MSGGEDDLPNPGVTVTGRRPAFSAAEHARRRDAVARLLDEHDLAALVVYGAAGYPGPIHYLTDYTPRQPTWLIISPDRPPTLFLHFVNHVPNAKAVCAVDDVRCYWPSAVDAVAAELAARGAAGRRIGVAGLANAVPYGQAAGLRRSLGSELTDIGADLNRLRWIRSDEEIQRIRRSGEIIDNACDDLAAQLHPGLTELDAKAILHASFIPKGGEEGIIFISSTGMDAPDRKSPWQFPGHRIIGAGHVLITEITINYYGYGAQGHRPFAVGAPPSPLYRELFDVAATCFDRILAVLRDGATAEEVRDAAMVVRDRDFTLFDSVLHGEAGRNPELGSSGSDHTFEPWTFRAGQVMVIQPNPVTRDGRAGLQAGAAVLIEKDGATPLHGYPLRFHEC